MSCSSALASCEAGWADANSSLAHALAIVEAITSDPCLPTAGARRDLPLRIAAVFIVFVASFAGVLTTTAGKVAERFAPSAFAIALGKTVGTGVVIACALVHMLQPADKSLTSACLPLSFHAADYGAYAFLFAMYAALGMHLVEYALRCERVVVSAQIRGRGVSARRCRGRSDLGVGLAGADADAGADAFAGPRRRRGEPLCAKADARGRGRRV